MDETLVGRLTPLQQGHVPGLAAVVVDRDGPRAVGATGWADLRAQRPASPRMVCPWFSMTKIVTATMAMRLVDQGTLDLDEPVAPHVPQLRRLTPAVDSNRITARHLLSHTAGLRNPVPVRWVHPASAPAPEPDAFLDGLLTKHPKLRSSPGGEASYSNLGPLVMALAMASLTGTPFVELVRKQVLEPLGMKRTGFTYLAGPDDAATGYHPRWSPMRLLLPRWVMGPGSGRWVSFEPFLVDGAAYGGLVGPLEDVARFLQMHLRDGELEDARMLQPGSAEAMRDLRARGYGIDVGLGWFRPADMRGADPPFVEHLGGGAGFFNVIRMYPTRGVGIVVMGNATKYDIDGVARLALSY